MRHIVLDTETTGLEPAQGHRVVEIGCVEIVNRRLTRRNFHVYLNPDRDSDPGALAVHGLTREFLEQHPRFAEQADAFLEFVQGAHVIIHNAAFDVRFLDAELARLGKPAFTTYAASVIDSLQLARELHPGKRNNLDILCDRYGISNSHRVLHGALLDSELLAEVWLAMTRGQHSLIINADDGPDPAADADQGQENHLSNLGELPIVLPSADELSAHEQYLAGLDKTVKGSCLWRQVTAPATEDAA